MSLSFVPSKLQSRVLEPLNAIEPNWQALLIFLTAWSVACAGWLLVGGSLPFNMAPLPLRRRSGLTLICLNIALLTILTAVTVGFAFAELRWTSIVIGGGVVLLFSPFAVQDLPRPVRDTRLGQVGLSVIAAATIGLLYI